MVKMPRPPCTPPSCDWLASASSEMERGCREAALRSACDRLLAVSAENRPRTLTALARFLRHALRVRAYVVSPSGLLPYLSGVSDEAAQILALRSKSPPCKLDMLQQCPEDRGAVLHVRWGRSGVQKDSAMNQVRWIEAAAYLERAYAAADVAGALCSLGLLTQSGALLEWVGMSPQRCADRLPALRIVLPRQPWSAGSSGATAKATAKRMQCARRVPLPSLCCGAFIGSGGAKVRATHAALLLQAFKRGRFGPLSLQLQVSRQQVRNFGPVHIDLKLTRVSCLQATQQQSLLELEACADELAASLKAHIVQLFTERLAQNALRREQRVLALEDAGRKYHEDRAAKRAVRQARGSGAARALELPSAEISAQMPAGVGRGKPAHRRRAAQREKRQRLLCALVALEQGQVRGDARRLQRHAALCRDDDVACQAIQQLEARCTAGCRARQQLRQRPVVPRRAQRCKLGGGRGERAALMLRVGLEEL